MTVEITFATEEMCYGSVAEPVPANRILENWYKKLPVEVASYASIHNFGHSVKACPPFLDAMTLGHILCLPADIKIKVMEGGSTFDAKWRFPGPMIESHAMDHIKGHPKDRRSVIKIFTYWSVYTPPGWSIMLFPPLNRAELPFEAMAAVIDTDTFNSRITIPCFVNLPDGLHTIAKGTPLAQIIPFKREAIDVTIRAETEAETKKRTKQEMLLVSEFGSYYKNVRHKA